MRKVWVRRIQDEERDLGSKGEEAGGRPGERGRKKNRVTSWREERRRKEGLGE